MKKKLQQKRFKTLLKVLKRVKRNGYKVDLDAYQMTRNGKTYTTEKKLVKKKGVACAVGWFIISPEWKKAGGKVYEFESNFDNLYSSENELCICNIDAEFEGVDDICAALSKYLGIDRRYGELICNETFDMYKRQDIDEVISLVKMFKRTSKKGRKEFLRYMKWVGYGWK